MWWPLFMFQPSLPVFLRIQSLTLCTEAGFKCRVWATMPFRGRTRFEVSAPDTVIRSQSAYDDIPKSYADLRDCERPNMLEVGKLCSTLNLSCRSVKSVQHWKDA